MPEMRCHECEAVTDESCNRCRRPTCGAHYHEREHLGLCTCCGEEITAVLRRGGAMIGWPYPLRKPFETVEG